MKNDYAEISNIVDTHLTRIIDRRIAMGANSTDAAHYALGVIRAVLADTALSLKESDRARLLTLLSRV